MGVVVSVTVTVMSVSDWPPLLLSLEFGDDVLIAAAVCDGMLSCVPLIDVGIRCHLALADVALLCHSEVSTGHEDWCPYAYFGADLSVSVCVTV